MKNLIRLIPVIAAFILMACNKDDAEDTALLPVVETVEVTDITATLAVAGGNITDTGGNAIIAQGVCWSTTENPTIENDNLFDDSGDESFVNTITGLSSGTTYYVRAFATNQHGTGYGRQRSFTTDGDPTIPVDPGGDDDDDLNPNSQPVNYNNAIRIVFSSAGATVENSFTEGQVAIENNNGHVVIRPSITNTEMNIILSGITYDGSVKIYGDNTFGLILNGTGITNPTGAAINIQSKETASVVIVNQTNNRLIDGEQYTTVDGEDMKATFFSEGDVEISGNGSLEIRGKNRHALCSDGALWITGGNINIKEATSDAIHANDEVTVSGGQLTTRFLTFILTFSLPKD